MDRDTITPDLDIGQEHKDRHEPRGRKPNDQLPPSRAREVQRAFRLRRAEHLAALEERINILEAENSQLRALLALPEADRSKIGSGPTGKGKTLREGGVPMSERVRARKEARERERRAKAGLPPLEAESAEESADREIRDSTTISPRASSSSLPLPLPLHGTNNSAPQIPLFSHTENPPQFNYNLPLPFNLPVTPDPQFPDFTNSIDSMLKGGTPNFGGLFNMFGTDDPIDSNRRQSPISPPITASSGLTTHVNSHTQLNTPNSSSNSAAQPDLLTRLKACCHLSDSHVVNDPGLLIFATRLCQSFPCQFGGAHTEFTLGGSDPDFIALDDSWRSLKQQLDPDGEADGENRINTGRMAAELVVRAAHSRGQGIWILCRFREGMSIKRALISGLVQGLGGKFD